MRKLISFILIFAIILSVNVSAQNEPPEILRAVLTNCDTGRTIYADGYNQFIMHKYSDGSMSMNLERSETYLDFSSGELNYSNEEFIYTLIDCGYNRFKISLQNGKLLADSGEGDNNIARVILEDKDSNKINTAWYITDEQNQPIKILTIGDSITYGVNPDDKSVNKSYRKELSQYLVDYFGKVCFVGTESTPIFTATDKPLMRHSGYPGYVIEDIYNVDQHPGMSNLVDPMLEKYSPDIVLVLLGTNDCGMLSINSEIDKLVTRWESFIRNIEYQLSDNGTVFCASLPDMEGKTESVNRFNKGMKERLESLKAEGLSLSFVDINTAFNGDSKYISSDGVHISNEGNSVMAETFCRAIALDYGRNGIKGEGGDISFIEQNNNLEPDSHDTEIIEKELLTFEVYLAIGGILFAFVIITLLIILKKKNK